METINRTLKVIVLLLMLVGFAPSASVTLTTTKAAVTANQAATDDEVEAMKEDLRRILEDFMKMSSEAYGELHENATEDEAPELYQDFEELQRLLMDMYERVYYATTMEELNALERMFRDYVVERFDAFYSQIISLYEFSAATVEGIVLKYRIIEKEKTAKVKGIGDHDANCTVTIPETVNGYTVNGIADYAFQYARIGTVVMPETIKTIGEFSFYGCSRLLSLSIPNSVTTIIRYAFAECTSLASVTIPKSVSSIGECAFEECPGLTSISVEPGNTKYDSRNNCNAIIETASNTLITGCKNTIIPNTVTNIGAYSFMRNSLTSITIPSSVTKIGFYAFYQCRNLTSVTVEMKIPVEVEGGISTFQAAGYSIHNVILYVPKGCKAAYESADIWKEFKEIVEIDASNEEENTLTFHYAKESGLYRDYSTPTLGTPNWNYPEALLMQLNQISSSNKRFAADYDFAYSNAGFDFVDGRYRGYSDSLLIQVSPDLDLTYSEISLLNSDNEDIINAGLVVLTEVKRHDDEGRWVIKIKLQDGKIDALLDQYLSGKYAVAVDNNIVTGYDVSLELVKTGHAYDFNVNGVSVAGIHNRYTNTEQSQFGMTTWTDDPDNNPNSFRYEMTWHGGEAYSTILFNSDLSESDLDDRGLNTCIRHGHSLSSQRETSGTDNRQNQPILPVAPNCTLPYEDGAWIKIDIEFPDYNEEGKFTPIRGFFVTLDNHFAIEGGNSEKNAWAVYEYRNVAKYSYDNDVKDIYGVDVPITLQPGNKGSIYIKKTNNVIGDVIGFRVHAVNLDGTLTDPDGRAFYVKVCNSEQVTNIEFADNEVKAICVANWDTNEDGELSYDEAAAVTDLGEAFSENEEIVSFNELQYFTGLTRIAREAFYGCINLEEIMLPEGLTIIGEESFSYCHISSLVLPESLIRICEQAFEGCYLTTITIPKNVAHLGSPEEEPGEEENLYASVFSGCHFLTAVNVDEENMVYASINGLLLTKDLKTLLYCPNGITGNVVIPEGTEYLRSTSFSEGLLTTVTLPVSLKYIDNFVFELCEQLTSVTAKMKRPCETSWDAFYSINTKATLYVPLGSKRNYEKANHWKEFKKIVEMGIEPLNEDEDVDFSNVGSDLAEETDLTGTVVNNMYYNIGTDAGGYSAEDGCIVITKETSDEQMEALEGLGITDEELKQNFTGIIFKVPAGKGKVTVTAETTGNMTLKVKVGNGETMEMELSGKLKMKVPYNVSEESLVYIFAGTQDAARGMLRTNGEQSLKIYGIELDIEGMVGDANNDGDVNAADIEEVANAIVGNPSEKYNKAAADIDGNGIVDVSDLTQIVEIVKAKH